MPGRAPPCGTGARVRHVQLDDAAHRRGQRLRRRPWARRVLHLQPAPVARDAERGALARHAVGDRSGDRGMARRHADAVAGVVRPGARLLRRPRRRGGAAGLRQPGEPRAPRARRLRGRRGRAAPLSRSRWRGCSSSRTPSTRRSAREPPARCAMPGALSRSTGRNWPASPADAARERPGRRRRRNSGQRWCATEKASTVVVRYVSPGRRTVDGKLSWLGESG